MRKKTSIRHDPIVKDFAAKLKQERLRQGLSQRELAQLAQINVNYQGKLERAEAAPGIDMVGRLAKALGVAPAALLGTPEPVSAVTKMRDALRRRLDNILRQNDPATIQALAVLAAHIEDSLARNR